MRHEYINTYTNGLHHTWIDNNRNLYLNSDITRSTTYMIFSYQTCMLYHRHQVYNDKHFYFLFNSIPNALDLNVEVCIMATLYINCFVYINWICQQMNILLPLSFRQLLIFLCVLMLPAISTIVKIYNVSYDIFHQDAHYTFSVSNVSLS